MWHSEKATQEKKVRNPVLRDRGYMESLTSGVAGLAVGGAGVGGVGASSPAAAAAASLPRRTAVVVGGTGRQGGATIRALLASTKVAWKIVAITRDVHQDVARELAAKGVILEQADATKRATLDAALAKHVPIDAFYCVTNPFTARWTGLTPPKTDVSSEEVQGRNMADAARAAGVRHFVFSSCACASDSVVDGKPIPTFASKAVVEEYLKAMPAGALPYSILGLVGFFENMTSSFAGIKQGVLPGLLRPSSTPLQMIAIDDIGFFARMMMEDPATWACGRRLDIAGDGGSIDDKARSLSKLRGGEKFAVSIPPDFVFWMFIPAAISRLKQFLEKKGTHVDIAECKRLHPQLMNFEDWIVHTGMDKKKLDAPSRCSVQ